MGKYDLKKLSYSQLKTVSYMKLCGNVVKFQVANTKFNSLKSRLYTPETKIAKILTFCSKKSVKFQPFSILKLNFHNLRLPKINLS